mgnify:CR=1 FL=1|jgi:hypothetical protein
MNEELMNIALRYPELLDKFNERYRAELFALYIEKNPVDKTKKKYAQAADIYNQAYKFKVTSISRVVQQSLGVSKGNANMLINYAKGKNLISKPIKTTHGKGYLQKNYVPKSEGIKA